MVIWLDCKQMIQKADKKQSNETICMNCDILKYSNATSACLQW